MADAPLGAVVLHGLTGHPKSVEGVAAALEAAGVPSVVPLLPGHGTSVDDLEQRRWDEWVAAAEAALEAAGDRVLAVGLSVGGSLACRLAADHPRRVAGVVAINPFIDPPAESFREALREMVATGFPRAPGIGGDQADTGAEGEGGYDELPLSAVLTLAEGLDDLLVRLPRVTCPLLLFTSRADHVVPPVSSDVLAERVGGPVERVWLERSYHVATLDFDREEIERRTVEFARRVRARGPAQAAAYHRRDG
ncbi:MAG: alpha/beta hydrolase [Acidimicrobiia bacterium]